MSVNIYERLLRLKEIEAEFGFLIKNDRKNWIRVAKLLQQVEEEVLYELRVPSFTQYVKGLAKENSINVSTLWRCRSAAVAFMEIAGLSHVEELEGRKIKTTPEQLEMYSKIRTIAPERIVRELQDKMLMGEGIRNELRSLWATYRPLKRGQTERGRRNRWEDYQISVSEASQMQAPFTNQEEMLNALIAKGEYEEFTIDGRKREKYSLSPEEVLRTNIANALRNPAWAEYTLEQTFLSGFQGFPPFIPGQLSGMPLPAPAGRIDAMALARVPSEEATPPIIFGASIRVTLASLKGEGLLLQNAGYCHYYYLAIPLSEEFIEEALKHTPKKIGIIGILADVEDAKHQLKIVRRARYHAVEADYLTTVMTDMAMMLMGWGANSTIQGEKIQ